MELNLRDFSDTQINVKLAKLSGWKFANGKWWHDDLGDGPPSDYVGALGRERAENVIASLLRSKSEKTSFVPSGSSSSNAAGVSVPKTFGDVKRIMQGE